MILGNGVKATHPKCAIKHAKHHIRVLSMLVGVELLLGMAQEQ